MYILFTIHHDYRFDLSWLHLIIFDNTTNEILHNLFPKFSLVDSFWTLRIKEGLQIGKKNEDINI